MRIFNASPLILLLEEIEEPEIIKLLNSLDNNLLIPYKVSKEIISKKARKNLDSLINDHYLKLCKDPDPKSFYFFKQRFPMLDDGELAVITLTDKMRSEKCMAIIDEFKGREVAIKLKLPLRGIFGIVLELYNSKLINENKLKDICRKIDKSHFRINFKKLGYEWVVK